MDRDFVSFCMPCIPEVHDEVPPSQKEMSRTEKSTATLPSQGFHSGSGMGNRSADMRKVAVFIIAIILIMSLFWILGLISSNHNKAASNGMQQTEKLAEKAGNFVSESTAEAEKDSYILRYEGFDTEIEIFLRIVSANMIRMAAVYIHILWMILPWQQRAMPFMFRLRMIRWRYSQ